jgi:hypothetical protein
MVLTLSGPLAAGALSGNCFGVDREEMAKELDFDGLESKRSPNMLSAMEFYGRSLISQFCSRGFAMVKFSHDSHFKVSITVTANGYNSAQASCSYKWFEHLIIYSTGGFRLVQLADA